MDLLQSLKDHYFVTAAFCVWIISWIYFHASRGVCKSEANLDGKTVIITGSNTGIGKATAFNLARRGAKVIIACRNLELANSVREKIVKKTNNSNIVVKFIDLSSLASVRKFAEEIVRSEMRLDVLIHNAGVLIPNRALTEEGLNMSLAVNVFGPFLLTHLLIDLLKKTDKSRIVVVSSSAHILGHVDLSDPNPTVDFSTYSYLKKRIFSFKIYCVSKFANVLLTKELARRLKCFGVTVNCLHPGLVVTSIVWHPFSSSFIKYFTMLSPMLKTIEEGAQTSVYLAVSEEVEGVTGKYFVDCKEAPSAKITSDDLAKQYFEVCKNVVQLQPTDPQI